MQLSIKTLQRRKSLSACDVMEPNNESGYNNDGFEVEIIDMEKEMNEGKITPIIAQKNGCVLFFKVLAVNFRLSQHLYSKL